MDVNHRNASALVLALHGVRDIPERAAIEADLAADRYCISAGRLAHVLAELDPQGTVTAAGFPRKVGGEWHILTLDDGFHTDYEVVFPMLLRCGIRATFFVTADCIGRAGYTSAAQLREMASAGMEIASHGLTHRYLVTMPRRDATREILESKRRLEDLLGIGVSSFAPAGGHFARWMLDAAAEAGYTVFATMVPGRTVRTGAGMQILRRNHIQAHHDPAYVSRLLRGDPRTLLANEIRYRLLAIPKALLGMSSYDRLKGCALRLLDGRLAGNGMPQQQ